MSGRSGLYGGHVVHVRLRPVRHRLSYRVFSLLVDLDEAPALSAGSRLFGFNRPAPLSLWEKDHGDGRKTGLAQWVGAQLEGAGIALERPRIAMLCYPRMFGYVFNPLTVYFCADAAGVLRAALYEVCNTFGERRSYVVALAGPGPDYRHAADKALYVSPFVPMACRYAFHLEPPGEAVRLGIDESDAEGLLLRTAFSGRRQPLDDRSLLKALVGYPLMTLKIIGAIHWEAMKLWAKGVPVFRHAPAPRKVAPTIVATTKAD